MKAKYLWSVSTFCNDYVKGKADSVDDAIKKIAEMPLFPGDWIQTVIISKNRDDKHPIMACRGNYNEKFCQHGAYNVPELNILMNR